MPHHLSGSHSMTYKKLILLTMILPFHIIQANDSAFTRPVSIDKTETPSLFKHPDNTNSILPTKNEHNSLYQTALKTDIFYNSGIILGPDGPVLTTAQALNNCHKISISSPNGIVKTSSILAMSTQLNLALIDFPFKGNGWPLTLRTTPITKETFEVTGYDPNRALLTEHYALATNQNPQHHSFTIENANLNTTIGGGVFDSNGNLSGLIIHSGTDIEAIDNTTLYAYLTANHVSMATGSNSPSPLDKIITERPDEIVVRIGCDADL